MILIMLTFSSKPIISNVVATSDLKQNVDINKFSKHAWGIHDPEIYGGRCGYVKTPEMKGRVTVFPSGKLISIGAKSIENAKNQIHLAKFQLLRDKFIDDIKPKIKIQNIVATLNFNSLLDLNKIVHKLNGATYEPDQFPGIILKNVKNTSFLIFSSGKIVLAGAKSMRELKTAGFELLQKLEFAMYEKIHIN